MNRLSSSSPVTPKSSRAVSFYPQICVKKTIHIQDYSDEEKTACWYSPEETASIREQAMAIVNLMERVKTKEASIVENEVLSKHFCFRGLELLTKEGRRFRIENRFRCWNVVLDEQEFQDENSIFDDEAIAAVYAECTVSSTTLALGQGISDQHHVLLDMLSSSSTKKNVADMVPATMMNHRRTVLHQKNAIQCNRSLRAPLA